MDETKEYFSGGMKQIRGGMEEILDNRAGETDKGITTALRAQNRKLVSSSEGREILVEHHRQLGTKTNGERFYEG